MNQSNGMGQTASDMFSWLFPSYVDSSIPAVDTSNLGEPIFSANPITTYQNLNSAYQGSGIEAPTTINYAPPVPSGWEGVVSASAPQDVSNAQMQQIQQGISNFVATQAPGANPLGQNQTANWWWLVAIGGAILLVFLLAGKEPDFR